MCISCSLPNPRNILGQGKTKSKARYLKRKKSRRKARKSAAPKQANNAVQSHKETDEEDSDDTRGEDNTLQERSPNISQLKDLMEEREGDREERPKKKRKLSLLDLEDERNHMDIEGVPVTIGNDSEVDASLHATNIKPTSPELQMSLPVFTLPALPDAPSKSILALQGLDQALVGAEVVNPSSRLPITPNGDDTRSGLSERTRRRLLELGITELFAG